MGNVIPFDGIVSSGEAMVNQASLTGESIPVPKRPGSSVYAGTVVEEGECVLTVTQQSGEGRYDKIVAMIEESEQPAVADAFDYYYVPTFYVDGVKVHEGGIYPEEVEKILRSALE